MPADGKKPDELAQVLQFASRHGTLLMAVVLVAVVLTIAVPYYRGKARSNRQLAGRLVFQAQTPQDLETFLAEYDSAPAVPLALMKLAKMHFHSGYYANALQTYEDFIARHHDHHLYPAALLGKAHCLEALDRKAEALESFLSFAELYPRHALASIAMLGRARCLEEMGRTDEAIDAYNRFIAAHPTSGFRDTAEEALARMGRRIPESEPPLTDSIGISDTDQSPSLPEP